MTFFTRTFSSPSTPLPSHPRTHILHHRAFTKLQTQPRRYLSAETKTAIESAIATSPVVLFMKGTPETPQCGFSRASIQILGLQGVDPEKFSAFNVLEDDGLRAGIKEFSEWPTIPQLYVGGEFVGGCDILVAMHQSGELAKLLEERGVVVEGGAEAGG
ncbi:glutaredoxin [Calycina marina]|uniref:Monothiol glutaredoxin-5, mitochondrial n=1 Tax=Calycina marina TaxID=1763456 RepID=A0A9P7Z272_9HELO|nr:glutaredoxin [Calycina marina]